MLLENQQIVAIQIKRLVNMKKIECISEEGESIQLHLTTVEKNDPLFWWSLVRIYTAQLWIPIWRQTRTLLETDWLQDETLNSIES
ncbi:hypothetical protein FC15_GL000496 [Lapidilactobacillus concavus DSM 17758]|jgi:hypothetical protein|uniref:Uncharacterized protein n=1 Tax=Lapidilactobacillus concavus DSM 17758 TaxID=1423735 RepID=A0A0R1WCR9_9LACO|nr:hypothetical protein [Lapidilactobacillus concavus]KRM13876.1 hypothetical protein FC15_GL000496 [Lapidilactobacillus concavus DSM 17758]GEL13165.1 hypothetical protein LCO01nite_07140 [Lapidilactobacillus concavus]